MNKANLTTLSVQLMSSDDDIDDIGNRICEVVKAEFGVDATFSVVPTDADSMEFEQDIVRTPVIEGVINLNYISAYLDVMQTDEFKTYEDAKQTALNLIQSRPKNSLWFALEITSSTGEQMWYWDGRNVYEF